MKSGKIIQKELLRFCQSMRREQPWLYSYSASCPPTLWASAETAMVLYLIGELQKLDAQTRQKWIEYIQSCQDEETGLFICPEYHREDQPSRNHPPALFHRHGSAFIMGALHELGALPKYPIRWCHPCRDPKKMVEWIESLDWWRSAWVVGNWTYDMACAMGFDYLITKDPKVLEGMNAYFDWFDRNQLSDTGFWDRKPEGSGLAHQEYGGYHTLMGYWMWDRPIAKADRIIDSCLSLQHADGMFGMEAGGGCCQDMDVIDPLVCYGLATDYRRADITRVLTRALPPILAKQGADGGFGESAEFGWKLCVTQGQESGINSCLFYGFSVALMGKFLKNEIVDTPWHHHTTYSHCVHREVKIK